MPTYKDLILSSSLQNSHALLIVNNILSKATSNKTTALLNILNLVPNISSVEAQEENTNLIKQTYKPRKTPTITSRIELKKAIIDQGRNKYAMTDAQIAYVLATVKKECDFVSRYEGYYSATVFATAKIKHGNYYGRGYVQLTWENNYRKMQNRRSKFFNEL